MLQDFIIPNTKTLQKLQRALGVTFTNTTYANTGQIIVAVDPAIAVVLDDMLKVWKTFRQLDKS